MEKPRGARLLHKLLVLYQRVALYEESVCHEIAILSKTIG